MKLASKVQTQDKNNELKQCTNSPRIPVVGMGLRWASSNTDGESNAPKYSVFMEEIGAGFLNTETHSLKIPRKSTDAFAKWGCTSSK